MTYRAIIESAGERPSYNDVFELLADHSDKTLPFFADAWSRWPVGDYAARVIDDLRNVGDWQKTRRPEISIRIDRAIAEIIRREAGA